MDKKENPEIEKEEERKKMIPDHKFAMLYAAFALIWLAEVAYCYLRMDAGWPDTVRGLLFSATFLIMSVVSWKEAMTAKRNAVFVALLFILLIVKFLI